MPFSAAAFRATAAGRAHQDVDVEQSAVIGNRALRFGARRPKPQAAFVHPHIEKDQLNLPDFVSNADPHQCDGTKGKENLSSCDQTKKLMISSSMMRKRVIRFGFWLNCAGLEARAFASCEESRFGLGRE